MCRCGLLSFPDPAVQCARRVHNSAFVGNRQSFQDTPDLALGLLHRSRCFDVFASASAFHLWTVDFLPASDGVFGSGWDGDWIGGSEAYLCDFPKAKAGLEAGAGGYRTHPGGAQSLRRALIAKTALDIRRNIPEYTATQLATYLPKEPTDRPLRKAMVPTKARA